MIKYVLDIEDMVPICVTLVQFYTNYHFCIKEKLLYGGGGVGEGRYQNNTPSPLPFVRIFFEAAPRIKNAGRS